MRVERTVQIAAPPGELYEIVMDPNRLADWVTIHRSLDDAPDGQLRKGSELTQTLHLAGRDFKVAWRVVENDRDGGHVVWEGKGPLGSRARVEYRFEAADGGTRFGYVNEYRLPGGPLGRAFGPAVRRLTVKEVDGTLEKLRGLSE
jgi:carbon monoxide dehydrogenase subunit G